MVSFNKFDKGRGGKSFGGGGGRSFGGHSGPPRQMFQATCSKCGQTAEVPFRPTGDRPVFCSNCFKSQGNLTSSSSPRFVPKSFGGGNRGGFSGNAGAGSPAMGGGAPSKGQFDALNIKLDKIISLLSGGKISEAPKAKVVEVKEKKEVVKKAKAKKGKKK